MCSHSELVRHAHLAKLVGEVLEAVLEEEQVVEGGVLMMVVGVGVLVLGEVLEAEGLLVLVVAKMVGGLRLELLLLVVL